MSDDENERKPHSNINDAIASPDYSCIHTYLCSGDDRQGTSRIYPGVLLWIWILQVKRIAAATVIICCIYIFLCFLAGSHGVSHEFPWVSARAIMEATAGSHGLSRGSSSEPVGAHEILRWPTW